MTQPTDAALFDEIAAKRFVSAQDVLEMRRAVYPDGGVSQGEIERLFALAAKVEAGDPAWKSFFDEACADCFLNEETPRGHVTADEFAVLKGLVERTGAPSRFEIEAFVTLHQKAKTTPAEMSAWLGEQLVGLIARKKPAPQVSAEDAALFKRFVYGLGSPGNVAVTRSEAEFLLSVEAVARDGANAPEWGALYAKALSAHLMQHVDAVMNTRAEDIRQHEFVEDAAVNPVGFMNRMLKGGLAGFRSARSEADEAAEREAARHRAAADAEVLTDDEGAWLADHLGADGVLSISEMALMERLKELGAPLPEPLKALAEAS